MKSNFYLLPVLALVFSSCLNTQKMLDKGNYQQALTASARQLQKKKVNPRHIYAFEYAFRTLNEADVQEIERLKSKGEPHLWIDIHQKVLRIEQRQKRMAPALTNMQQQGLFTEVRLYPVKEKLRESTDNVALYYYASASEHIPSARSGDRLAARKAHRLLNKCRDYRANFKDALTLQKEMYDLGTTHLLIKPTNYELEDFIADDLFDQLFEDRTFPYREDWEVFHLSQTEEEVDIQVEVYFSDLFIGGNNETSDYCSRSEEIQVGCEEVKVWSDKDSCFVVETRPIYQIVTGSVTTFEQSKTASVTLRYNLFDIREQKAIDYQEIDRRYCWTNEYSFISGDDRALGGLCSPAWGNWTAYPSDRRMIEGTGARFQRPFFKKLERYEL